MNPLRVLIADDAPEFRKSVRAMLAFERGLEVVAIAGDGEEAVALAKQHQPDVAVMDIHMPKMDGLTAIRLMSQVSPQTVCMIMSSEGERDTLRQAMGAGVREYLIKPFTPEEFVSAVKRAALQALKTQQMTSAARDTQAERDRYLLQLVRNYLEDRRADDEAAKVYAEYLAHPTAPADPAVLTQLAEVFLARRDWRTLGLVCQRMERLTSL